MNPQLVQRIRDCAALPSLPAIALQVLELAQKDDSDIAQIARVISKDPALSSKILRTVNSSFYGRGQAVSTISHALVILGLQSVKTLVLGFSLVTTLSQGQSKGFNHVGYWKRSIYAATAARTIAAKVHQVQGEECFLCALLMDIGMLVLEQVLAAEYGALVEKSASHGELLAAENAALGLNHAEVSGLLAAHWKLPPILTVPMTHHHGSDAVKEEPLRDLARVIELAARCADVYVDEQAAGAISDVRAFCLEKYKMPQADCDAMMEDIGKRTREIAPLFDISVGSATYESILNRANETLVELTLNTQRQAATLQVQATTLQEQASNLVVQNQKLKVEAAIDALTGLANRGAFDRFLAAQFADAMKHGKLLAILMLDVDHFKLVNDTHGHPVGDAILKSLGKILAAAAKKTDQASRFGGEEMVLVLPGTPRAEASARAELIRKAIASRPLVSGNLQIPVTVSIGVAVYEPGSPFREPNHLLKAADLSVYAAKHAGRNCVKVFMLKAPATTTAA